MVVLVSVLIKTKKRSTKSLSQRRYHFWYSFCKGYAKPNTSDTKHMWNCRFIVSCMLN